MYKIIFSCLFILFSILTLSEFEQNAFAQSTVCQAPHCFAISSGGTSTPTQGKGVQYDIRVPDLVVPASECLVNSVAVATSWVRFDNNDWIELGVTAGAFNNGNICIDDREIAYWGYGLAANFIDEFEIGTVPVGSIQHFELSNLDGDINWEIYWQDGTLADQLILLNPISDITDIGIEGSIPECFFFANNSALFTNSKGIVYTLND